MSRRAAAKLSPMLRQSRAWACAALLLAFGCGGKKAGGSSSSAKASASASAVGVTPGGAPGGLVAPVPEGDQVQPLDPSKLTVKYTGQVNPNGALVFNLTNDTGKTVHWLFALVYAYDKDGKQLDFAGGEKTFRASWSLGNDVPSGQKVSESTNMMQADLPAGAAFLQTVVTQIEDREGGKIYNLEAEPPAQRPFVR